jgi:hypothetical protein
MMRAMSGSVRTGVILAVLLGFVACGGSTTSGRLREKVDSLDYPERELRLRLMDYTRLFSRSLARMTEEVLVATDDPSLRSRVLTIRINATALCQAAAFQPEPLAALVDTWSLTVQLREYAESAQGAKLLEDHQPLAVETMTQLEGRLDAFARYLPDPEAGPQRIREWAGKNPVVYELGYRPSPAAELATVSGDPKLTAFGAVESLNEQVADLGDRLSTLSVLMPELMRAEAMLVTEQTMARDDLSATRRDIRAAADSLERLARLDERLVELVETQRDVIVEKARTELQAVTSEVDRQRRNTLDALTKEREAVLASADKQRDEVLTAITAEREAILTAVDRETDQAFESARKEWTAMLEAIRSEREQTMIEIEAMTESALARTHESGEELIDRFFLRLAQSGGGLIVLGAVAMFLIRRFARRSAAA